VRKLSHGLRLYLGYELGFGLELALDLGHELGHGLGLRLGLRLRSFRLRPQRFPQVEELQGLEAQQEQQER